MKFFSRRNSFDIAQNPDKDPGEVKLKYPRAVFYILVVELCERFSYYGMRAVLTIYLRNVLGFSEDDSTSFYHFYLFLCYGTPIIGGILADSFLGKYRTILYIGIIYAVGNLTLSLASVPPLHLPPVFTSFLGLILIGIGTGGIKPCVVAIAAEQFTLPKQLKQQQKFFSLFMFIVAIGSMTSTLITPIFRKDVKCFGTECYPLAFGFPASLMLLAIGVFVLGKPLYHITKPKVNITVEVIKCLWHGFVGLLKSKKHQNGHQDMSGQGKNHWLNAAKDKVGEDIVKDTKGLTRLLPYFLPVPLFWSLYEQIGSRWTLQATRMDGTLWDWISIKPDQMQVINPILMFIFIPFFEAFVYPLFAKCNLLKRPLQRLVTGGALAAIAFVLAGVVEKQIEPSYASIPGSKDVHLNFINTSPCPLTLKMEGYNANLPSDDNFRLILEKLGETKNFTLESTSPKCSFLNNSGAISESDHGKVISVLIFQDPKGIWTFGRYFIGDDVKKSKEGNAKLRVLGNGSGLPGSVNNVKLINEKDPSKSTLFTTLSEPNSDLFSSKSLQLEPGRYRIVYETNERNSSSSEAEGRGGGSIDLGGGGSYQLVLFTDPRNNNTHINHFLLFTLTPSNTVHMLWLLPQYFVMVWAEVLFIISGLEFAYTEAPESMRSLIQSIWHLMNAIGNVIVIISAEASFVNSQSHEFFGFAILMGVDVIIFGFLAMRYKYVNRVHGPPEVKEDLNQNPRLEGSSIELKEF